MELISPKNANEQISTSNANQEKTPKEKEDTNYFSFKNYQKIKAISDNINDNDNNCNNNINKLSISIKRTNEKSSIKDNYSSRELFSNSAKKHTDRNSFLVTTDRKLNKLSEQTAIKSKLPKRDKRNSVLFDIMRSAIIDENSNRKYLATAKVKGIGEKNKFNVYDSSDDSDADICNIYLFFIINI